MAMMGFLVLFLIFMHLNIASSTGPVYMRCYCNLPECTDGGDGSYSCKSRTGCFQELPHYNLPQPPYRRMNGKGQPTTPVPENVELRYGCLELWPSESAPFQCTEPGIRKSPLTDARRDYELDETEQYGRTKNGGRRRTSGNRHHNHQNKMESRRWSAYDVPLRCCVSDMCNRRRFIPSASKFFNYVTPSVPTIDKESTVPTDDQSPSTTASGIASQQWWLTSAMILVPVIGGVTFLLLVAVGCWILHFGGGNTCRGKGKDKTLSGATVSIPAHYYFYDSNVVNAKKLASGESLDSKLAKPCNCVVVETTTDFSNVTTGGRCVHVMPIFLSKYHGDCIVSVKPADTRTAVR